MFLWGKLIKCDLNACYKRPIILDQLNPKVETSVNVDEQIYTFF